MYDRDNNNNNTAFNKAPYAIGYKALYSTKNIMNKKQTINGKGEF